MKIFLISVLVFATGVSMAQTVYRTIGSGTWATLSIWDRSNDGGATWGVAVTSAPTSNQSVIIRSGHTVTLDATKSCKKLTIEAGGRLSAGASTNAIRPGTTSSGTAGNVDTVQNDGIIGGPGELMVLELPNTCASLLLTGSGTYEIGRIRAITTNNNNPTSVTTNHANDARLIVDKDVKLNTTANYCFSMPNSAVATTDVMIFTVNAGKTVTITDPTSKWENTLMTSGGATNGGSYTYNINGTLDLSATTSTSAFIPYANASSSITVNVNGTVKLGTSFKADTVLGSTGAIAMNINNGGLVDASLTTSFNIGKTGTSANTTNGNIFWVTTGTGALKRTVPADGSRINFPVGTSISSYTPVSVSRDASVGSSAAFTVNVQNTFDNAPADPTRVVNKQWNITAPSGNPADTLRFSWTTAEQAVNFNPATVWVMHWTGGAWEYKSASVTGSGTAADPYVAKVYGFTSFSPFGVTSVNPIPLSLLSFNASYNGQSVGLSWKTTNELNSKNFVIERSEDGRNFSAIGTVNANNSTAENNYSFIDQSPVAGASFYRLKMVDLDGKFKYSNIVLINTKLKNKFSAYPNPATDNITISHSKAGANSTIMVYGTDGKQILQVKVSKDAVQTSLDISKLVTGSYHISFVNGSERSSLEFIKR